MANHKSAEKRHRQSLRRREINRRVRSASRTAIKKTRAAIATGDQQVAKTLLGEADRSLQSAVSKGVYKKKTASRYISRLATAVNLMSASA